MKTEHENFYHISLIVQWASAKQDTQKCDGHRVLTIYRYFSGNVSWKRFIIWIRLSHIYEMCFSKKIFRIHSRRAVNNLKILKVEYLQVDDY
jgi:hypothetical protein